MENGLVLQLAAYKLGLFKTVIVCHTLFLVFFNAFHILVCFALCLGVFNVFSTAFFPGFCTVFRWVLFLTRFSLFQSLFFCLFRCVLQCFFCSCICFSLFLKFLLRLLYHFSFHYLNISGSKWLFVKNSFIFVAFSVAFVCISQCFNFFSFFVFCSCNYVDFRSTYIVQPILPKFERTVYQCSSWLRRMHVCSKKQIMYHIIKNRSCITRPTEYLDLMLDPTPHVMMKLRLWSVTVSSLLIPARTLLVCKMVLQSIRYTHYINVGKKRNFWFCCNKIPKNKKKLFLRKFPKK